MNRTLLLIPALAAGLATAWLLPAGAQTAADSSAELIPLLTAVTQQQQAIAKNEAAIQASLARIQEDLRQAKIYATRGGSRISK